MIPNAYLTATLHYQEYDELIHLYYVHGERKIKLLDYSIYHVLIEDKDELQLNLNFGRDKFMPHAIKQIDDMIMLVPQFLSPEEHYHRHGFPAYDWREYLQIVESQLFIFPEKSLLEIWSFMSRPLNESISSVLKKDILTLWLITSGFSPFGQFLPTFIPDYGTALVDHIIAEHPETQPSIKTLLQDMLYGNRSLTFSNGQWINEGAAITAYLLSKDNSVEEWPALLKQDNQLFIRLNDYCIQVS